MNKAIPWIILTVTLVLAAPFAQIYYVHLLAEAEHRWPAFIELSKEERAELASRPTEGF